ncbi:hypothetical protein [Rosistilla ulvae]|uniref:hypothetical protein n=1 Tax=Rosistilla ulvae TaxID=1930277 RepID=UPI001FEC0021|nr:hypothetical protein [Rosistilla ulvae]
MRKAGPVDVADKTVAGFDPADLHATMPFVDRAVNLKLLLPNVFAAGGSGQT